MNRDRDPMTDSDQRAARRGGASSGALPGGDVTADEMSAASFPASDPPSTWTWELPADAADAEEPDDSSRAGRADRRRP